MILLEALSKQFFLLMNDKNMDSQTHRLKLEYFLKLKTAACVYYKQIIIMHWVVGWCLNTMSAPLDVFMLSNK